MSDCLALISVYNAQDFDNTAVIRETLAKGKAGRLHDKFQLWHKYKSSGFLENNLAAYAHVAFSAWAEILSRLNGLFADFWTR